MEHISALIKKVISNFQKVPFVSELQDGDWDQKKSLCSSLPLTAYQSFRSYQKIRFNAVLNEIGLCICIRGCLKWNQFLGIIPINVIYLKYLRRTRWSVDSSWIPPLDSNWSSSSGLLANVTRCKMEGIQKLSGFDFFTWFDATRWADSEYCLTCSSRCSMDV